MHRGDALVGLKCVGNPRSPIIYGTFNASLAPYPYK